MDCAVKQICRPGEMQRTVYDVHKRVHAIKVQAIATPNGLVANLYDPVEGRRHDSEMLADSAILPLLQQYSVNQNGNQLCIYGDLAYPLWPQLQTPFINPQLNPQQAAYNTAMSKARVGVEWVFGDIAKFLKFLDFKKNLKLGLLPIAKMYIVCALLINIHTWLYDFQLL